MKKNTVYALENLLCSQTKTKTTKDESIKNIYQCALINREKIIFKSKTNELFFFFHIFIHKFM